MIYIKKVCIDIDTRSKSTLKKFEDRIKSHWNVAEYIIQDTKKGYHIFVMLKRQIGVWDSFALRKFLGDDLRRLALDMLRWHEHNDLKILDVCFDRKTYINEKVQIK